MQLDLPSNPTLNQIYQQDGVIYQWTGVKWKRLNTRITTAVTEYSSIIEKNTSNFSIEPNVYDYYKIDLDSDLYVDMPIGAPYTSILMEFNRNVTDNNYVIGPTDISPSTGLRTELIYDFEFSADGMMAYTVEAATDTIKMYNLTSPWNIHDLFYSGHVVSIAAQVTNPYSLRFKPDGTKLYVLDYNPDNVYEYDLSNPWDITTLSYNGVFFAVGSQDSQAFGLYFKEDGTKMFILGGANDRVYEYSMSIPWTFSTLTYVKSFSIAAQTTAPNRIEFSSDGTKMFINSTNTTFQYVLSTPWDIATSTYDTSFADINTNTVYGFRFSSDGLKLFMLNYSIYRIYEYSLTTPWDIDTIIYPTYDNKSFSITSQFLNPYGVTLSEDGTNMYTNTTASVIYQYKLSTAWDISTSVYHDSYNISQTATIYSSPKFSPDGTKMYVVDSSNTAYQYELQIPWEIVTAVFVRSTTLSTPWDIHFKPDGTRMYVLYNTTNDTIYQYNLSTPWDISTKGSPIGSYNTGLTTVYGFTISNDGKKLFYVTGNSSQMYEVEMSTPWLITTAVNRQIRFNLSTVDIYVYGITFKPDGTKLYTAGGEKDAIQQYSTGTYVAPYISWSDNIEWEGGIAPSLDFENSSTFIIQFITYDGETWIGSPITTNLRSAE